MKKSMLGMVVTLAVCGLFTALPCPACAAGLTIGDGAEVRVLNGASISLGCQSLLIQGGGNMYLDLPLEGTEPGALYKCGKVQVNAGGYLYQGHGKIVHNCSVPSEIMLLLLE